MKRILQLHPRDNVGVAIVAVGAGEEVMIGHRVVRVSADISPGHKVALDFLEAVPSLRKRR